MRTLRLTELATTAGVELDTRDRDALRQLLPSVAVRPSLHREGAYDLTPGSWVGSAQVHDLTIEIRPKLAIDRVLFMLGYALDPARWMDQTIGLASAQTLVEAIVPAFVRQIRNATRLGVLQGYRTEEDALTTIRGRLRFDDQIRKRFGVFPPAEVRYDEFTEDIDENRIIKAALRRLGSVKIRSEAARRSLRVFDGAFALVTDVQFNPQALPEITFTRLNERYRSAIDVARLILSSSSLELHLGPRAGTAVMFDMNRLFEDFLVVALREALSLDQRRFPQGAKGRGLWLDERQRVRLRPDLSWWEQGECVFVGDAKYKSINVAGVEHADLYQLLAYSVAADLPGGLLVYAKGERIPNRHRVVFAGKELQVVNVNLAGTPADLLAEVRNVAALIRAWRARCAA